MSDLIKREDAIEAVWKPQVRPNGAIFDALKAAIESEIKAIPSADRPQDDEFKNFDRESLILLIEAQKERIGELLADRPQGEWIDAEIPLESGDTMPIQVCNLCKTFYPLAYTGGGHRFCPNCGARMKDVTEGLESRTDLIWYGDKTDLIGDETGRHTGWFGKGADDEDN